MCFSATASFLTAAVTGAAGVAAVQRTESRRELPLAAMPLIFAAQQAVEGALWLNLPAAPQDLTCTVLTHTFLVFALLFWPVFAPLSALAIEGEPWRRKAILACTVTGVAVSLYLLSVLMSSTHAALVKDGHIIYDSQPPPDPLVGIFYLVATGLGPALSTHRAVNLLSIIVVVGSLVAWIAYWDAFVSVWCFFAAGASVVILMHFQRARAIREVAAAALQSKLR
jgi:hypothetical protein